MIGLITTYTSAEYTIVFDNATAGVGGATMQTTKFVVMATNNGNLYTTEQIVYIQTVLIKSML